MTIRLIHPSRCRPQKAYNTYKKWIDAAGHSSIYVKHSLSLDTSDPKTYEYDAFFKGTKTDIFRYNNSSVVEATNKAAEFHNEDILIYLSDDFSCPLNWAPLIFDEFNDLGNPMVLKVDDCLQKFEVPVLTIPMMNKAMYKVLDYFWNPLYKSMFVDEDLYWTARKLGALKMAPHLKFPHEHHSLGKCQNDETYRRSEANWNQGKEVFARRKAEGFPI